jgi:hypothetical protein
LHSKKRTGFRGTMSGALNLEAATQLPQPSTQVR